MGSILSGYIISVMNILKLPFYVLLFIVLFSTEGRANNPSHDTYQQKQQLKALLDSKKYFFIAQSAYTAGGAMIQLTSEFFLKLDGDTLESHLPFFGVAFNASFSNTNSPLSFKSTDFNYRISKGKRGRLEIEIRLNKPEDPSLLYLSVSTAGFADLRVISLNRQPMSFYGEIQSLKD